ncbi:glycosyltransferase family 2 protein [Tilletiaria anomala UBC 951]|uniref:chitin synthase n=1 Tax=Tilletiaria anomala (strain ATCC 24038 / CBS 436.72 / UBC 951) TaxID=1037660 RepID=A0A066WNC8_TILAU|nr:glycosyltransferase family 2 protein [Tilletiaria anomala UBC 951]KDN52499.1 glycosyltransferase family 2 protein [Tilletiaria anomala UBC 951]
MATAEDNVKLSELTNLTADTVFQVLRDRFFSGLPYTDLSDSILVSVNPFGSTGNRNSPDTLREYTRDYRDTSKEARVRKLPPHIFATACNAYFYMRRTGQDQSILLNGETSSGKSELRRLALKALVNLSVSAPGKKGSKLAYQVPAAEFVLDSFGNCRTLDNANASRIGTYSELQFNDNGKLMGCKTLDYYLQKNRVVHHAANERTFHIFHYLIAGASAEEKEFLHLGDGEFNYLGGGRAHKEAIKEDSARFQRLKQAFKNIGLSKRQVASICQVLAAILHLGNVEFYQDRHRTQDSASVRNPEVLYLIAAFLGIQAKDLEDSLTYRTKMIKNEVCTILLDADGAAANRDDLAKSLYGLLFSWLNEHINEKLCRDDFDTYIGVVDLPGFENLSRGNSLDQFVINFANESMHRWMLKSIFESKKDEYADEGIRHLSPDVPFFDNAECVRLLTNQPGGLVHIIDDQARRQPKKTDHTMVEAFGKRWGNHPSFKVGPVDRSGFASFTISHFAGPVTYTSEALLERNSEVVSPDFVSLLLGQPAEAGKSATEIPGSQSSGSSIPFVKTLFSTRALKTQAHPKSDQTIVAAQQSVKPTRAPSTRRPNRGAGGGLARSGTLKKEAKEDEDSEDENADGTKKNNAVSGFVGEFRDALDTLFGTLDDTKPWFVFCLRPNDNQLPNQCEAKVLKQQIKFLGLAEMARKMLADFSVSMTYEEFCDRYASSFSLAAISMRGAQSGEAKQKFAAAKEVMGWSDTEAATGRVKVFLSHRAFRELEDELRAVDPEEVRVNEKKAQQDAEAIARGDADPFSPMGLLDESATPLSPLVGVFGDPFKEQSTASVPLVGGSGGPAGASSDLYMDDAKSAFSELTAPRRSMMGLSGAPSVIGSEMYTPSRNMFAGVATQGANEKMGSPLGAANVAPEAGQVAEEVPTTSARRKWVFITWLLTFWIPSPLLSLFGLKRSDVRMAWREKLTINFMVWFICGCAVFVIAILGNLICPREYVYSVQEFSGHKGNSAWTSIRGEVFNLNKIASSHLAAIDVVPAKNVLKYAGEDATNLFPVQVNALCNGITGTVSPWVQLSGDNNTDVNAQYHDFRAFKTDDVRPDWYYEQMWRMRSTARVGFMGYTSDGLNDLLTGGRTVAVYNGGVYDVSDYVKQGNRGVPVAPEGQQAPPNTQLSFMHDSIIQLFQANPGGDITKKFDSLPLSSEVKQRQRVCLRNLFFIGKPDHRNNPACLFSRYILLALSIVMVAIIGFKFLAALQFGRVRAPEDHDKFVICQVPCYTEGEESMRKTINSLAALKYDDKRKLIVIICDGMIVGSGNDRPTPRIVLDVLGSNPNLDPEPLSFLSLGEGAKQHNMGKVYSGLYENAGHVVPYIVIVKCGKPTERQRPGNRGKRDSQLVIMRFLNKVHFGLPMNPLELEMYHQIKNVIGVNPSFYEYILQVDADTTVEAYSLNRFISAFTNDKKVIGLCGETSLSNAKKSFITMLQVYEYYISHHLAKAFESLFGSVTCLPGCFSMFRIRTPDTHRPLFIANAVVDDYSENRVDTLHTKNLLHLGEDRYLTTLVLKHFGNYKTIFVRDAKAQTAAPEDWGVLLSQRRRWINSTVHNLFELILTPGLCGFCLFSMRFIVLIDLLSTIIAPVTVAYIVYLVVLVSTSDATVPVTSLIMLAAIYGLQAVIFLLNRKFEMIGWMFVYIIGIPIWSFFLPLYAFWHMDDFSWGNTRVVTGEKGKKVVIHDEGTFDPAEIPLKTWTDYENELWERNSAHSIGSIIQAAREENKLKAGSRAGSMYTPSLYGQPVLTHSQSFGHSPTHSAFGGSQTGGYMQDHRQSMMSQPYTMAPLASMGYQTPAITMYGGPPSLYGVPAPTYAIPFAHPSGSIYGGSQLGYSPQGGSGRATPTNGLETSVHSRSGSGALPSDAVLEADVRRLIAESDLSKITKKQIRLQLESKYATSLTTKKDFLNATVEKILSEAV